MDILIDSYINTFTAAFPEYKTTLPWLLTANLPAIIQEKFRSLSPDYLIGNGIAIHKSAVVEASVILKPPVIIDEGCFVGANAYLRGGVYLGKRTVVGTSCEVKTTVIMNDSAVAHFNFIGDSLIGSNVNFEAGSIVANHYNERTDKQIRVLANNEVMFTGTEKFGALVGDHAKIGANAVLSPGTILPPHAVVKRLELIQQVLD